MAKKNPKTEMAGTRISKELAQQLDDMAKAIGWSRSRIIEHALSAWAEETYPRFKRSGDIRIIVGGIK